MRRLLIAMTLALCSAGLAAPAVASPPGGTFFDDDDSVHEGAIEAIAAAGITVGCDRFGEFFCPDRAVTRAEMATFLVRALGLEPQEPARFIDAAGIHRLSIGAVEAAGLFKGCNPPQNDRFCPDDHLTRGQAAAVLVRAFDLPQAAGREFVDDDSSVFEDAIERLAAAGVTKGCNPPSNDHFCPDRAVSRAELATFLTRLLGLTPMPVDDAFQGRLVLGLWSGTVWYGGLAFIADTREPTVLIEDTVGEPDLSPDGSTIAYIDLRRECPPTAEGWWDCYSRIFTMSADGGEEIQMTPNDLAYNGYSWLADSHTVGLVVERDISDDEEQAEWSLATVDVANPLLVNELAGPSAYALWDAQWSVTGQVVAAAEQEFSNTVLLVHDGDGNELFAIAAAGRNLRDPDWSPDGSLLAFVIDGESEDQLVTSAPDGSDRTVLASAEHLTQPIWSPDGTRLAYLIIDDLTDGGQLVVNNLDGTKRVVVGDYAPPWSFAWSPDGSALGFTSDRRAWAVAADGGDPWPLTPTQWQVVSLDWGPRD